MVDKRVNVLAVDDEPGNLELIGRLFRRREGYSLRVAASSARALELLAETPADVIITDYAMPGMSGVALMERAQTLSPGALGIVVTAYPELQQVSEAQRRKLVDHIVAKPWKPDELLRCIEHALRAREVRVTSARVRASAL